MAFKVFIDGQEGTTNLRLLDCLSQYDDIELLRIAEDKYKDSTECARSLNAVDVTFLCLSNVTLREAVSLVSNPNACIIGASTAFRTSDDWIYGLSELAQGQRERLRNTKCIAVLGCHASAFVLLMYSLADADIVSADHLVTVFSLTGYSGGGKQMTVDHLVASNPKLDSPRPYALALAHKYLPEMRVQSKLSFALTFTLVVGNSLKGLVVTVGLHPQHLVRKAGPTDIARVLTNCYQGEQFIRMIPADNVAILDNGLFDVRGANDTNHTDLFVFSSDEHVIVTVRLGSLGKGATGAAVQCVNAYLDADGATSLHMEAPVPAAGVEYTVREAAPGLAS